VTPSPVEGKALLHVNMVLDWASLWRNTVNARCSVDTTPAPQTQILCLSPVLRTGVCYYEWQGNLSSGGAHQLPSGY
jgi:hypothetical protein